MYQPTNREPQARLDMPAPTLSTVSRMKQQGYLPMYRTTNRERKKQSHLIGSITLELIVTIGLALSPLSWAHRSHQCYSTGGRDTCLHPGLELCNYVVVVVAVVVVVVVVVVTMLLLEVCNV
jgi:hypothetical protein